MSDKTGCENLDSPEQTRTKHKKTKNRNSLLKKEKCTRSTLILQINKYTMKITQNIPTCLTYLKCRYLMLFSQRASRTSYVSLWCAIEPFWIHPLSLFPPRDHDDRNQGPMHVLHSHGEVVPSTCPAEQKLHRL